MVGSPHLTHENAASKRVVRKEVVEVKLIDKRGGGSVIIGEMLIIVKQPPSCARKRPFSIHGKGKW